MKLDGFKKFEDRKVNLSGVSGGIANGLTWSGRKSTLIMGKDTDANCECPPDEGIKTSPYY